MTYKERKQNLNLLLDQIKRETCSSLRCIAAKFSCSESTAKRMIADLREDGNQIYYCRISKKFKLK